MRRYVNGDERDLDPDAATVTPLGDRLSVRTSDGVATAVAVQQGETVWVSYRGHQYRVERRLPRIAGHHHLAEGEIRAPMPGMIVDVSVAEGDQVVRGQSMLVLEAMKTHQPFVAPFDGRVEQLPVSKNEQVSEGQLLAVVVEE